MLFTHTYLDIFSFFGCRVSAQRTPVVVWSWHLQDTFWFDVLVVALYLSFWLGTLLMLWQAYVEWNRWNAPSRVVRYICFVLLIGPSMLFVATIPVLLYGLYDITLCSLDFVEDEISVVGGQWFWVYVDTEVEHVAVVWAGTVIQLVGSSSDVLHSWFVPSYVVKLDLLSGRLVGCYFFVDEFGVVGGQCAEFCGSFHAFMPIFCCCV